MKSRIGGMPYFFSNRVSVTNDSFQKLFYGVVIVPRRASFSNWSGVVGVVFLLLHCSHLLNFIFECAGGTNIFVLGRALRTPPGRPHRGIPPTPYHADLPTWNLPIKKIYPRPCLGAVASRPFRFSTSLLSAVSFPSASNPACFAKYLFSEHTFHVASSFCIRCWMFCNIFLSASVIVSAVISIWSAGLSPAESRNATNALTLPAIAWTACAAAIAS